MVWKRASSLGRVDSGFYAKSEGELIARVGVLVGAGDAAVVCDEGGREVRTMGDTLASSGAEA